MGTPSARGAKNGVPHRPAARKNRKQTQSNKERAGLPQSRPILVENVANMAPTWFSKWSQDGQKIDAKFDHFFDTSWDQLLDDFRWIFDTKMEPSWYQNGIKNQC